MCLFSPISYTKSGKKKKQNTVLDCFSCVVCVLKRREEMEFTFIFPFPSPFFSLSLFNHFSFSCFFLLLSLFLLFILRIYPSFTPSLFSVLFFFLHPNIHSSPASPSSFLPIPLHSFLFFIPFHSIPIFCLAVFYQRSKQSQSSDL
jgi:hypothetical protein